VFCTIKHERTRAINRNGAGIRRRVRLVSAMEASGLKFH